MHVRPSIVIAACLALGLCGAAVAIRVAPTAEPRPRLNVAVSCAEPTIETSLRAALAAWPDRRFDLATLDDANVLVSVRYRATGTRVELSATLELEVGIVITTHARSVPEAIGKLARHLSAELSRR